MNTEVKKKSMTQEQKELLLKDLCARLPYGVKIQIDLQSDIYPPMICKVCNIDFAETGGSFIGVEVLPDSYSEYREFLCKPCLYPLSSITDEQEKELNKVYSDEADLIAEHLKSDISGNIHTHRFNHQLSLNWYLKNHFDINGLIPMGLAIDATNLNIY